MEQMPRFNEMPESSTTELVRENKPVIRMEFFRHDDKAKATTSGPRVGDEFVRLTPEGREHAEEVGQSKDPNPYTALAYGSTRERAVESAYHQMMANEESITPDDSLESIREKIGEELKVGKKEIMTPALDFYLDGSQRMHDEIYKHYLEDKDGLLFMVEESDAIARSEHDHTSSSYTRSAGNIAEIIQKYVTVLGAWERVNEEDPTKYEEAGYELQRFLGSHGLYVEFFLLKVVEMLEGREAAFDLIKENGILNGFNFSEGYTVTIKREESGEVSLILGYKGKEWTVTTEMLESIIEEKNRLNQETAPESKES